MKEYIKPEIEVKTLNVDETIAALSLSNGSVPDNKEWGKIYD